MVFVRRTPKPVGGFDVVTLLDNVATEGDIGLEVEVEGNKFPKTANHYGAPNVDPDKIPKGWRYVKDGSLRGADNAEYVIQGAIPFDKVPDMVNKLWKMFEDYGSVLDDSNRTSVHVHMNVQSWHLNRVTAFLAAYYILEEILTEWCGDHRVGNLFCLRAKDAPAIIQHVRDFIKTDGNVPFRENVHHYAALNTHALNKYGSLEFRALRGVLEPSPIIHWVEIIRRLHTLSGEYEDPRQLVENFSGLGPMTFFELLLGDKVSVVRQGISMNDSQIRDSLYEGIRMAQDICYCRDWSLFTPLEFKPDPFGREKRVVMNQLLKELDPDAAYATTGIQPGVITPAISLDEYAPEYDLPDFDED